MGNIVSKMSTSHASSEQQRKCYFINLSSWGDFAGTGNIICAVGLCPTKSYKILRLLSTMTRAKRYRFN